MQRRHKRERDLCVARQILALRLYNVAVNTRNIYYVP